MNEKAFKQLESNIDELRRILAKAGTDAAVFKVMTLIQQGPHVAREKYGLTSSYKQALFMLGQALLSPEPTTAADLEDTEWQRVWKLLEDCFLAYAWMYFERDHNYDGTHEQWLNDTEVVMPTFLNYFFSGDMTSVEQIQRRVNDVLIPFDSILEDDIGISATHALAVANWVSTELQRTLNIVSAGHRAYVSLIERAHRDGWSEEQFKDAASTNGDVLALQQNSFNVNLVRLKQLEEVFGAEKAKSFWGALVSTRGEVEEFRYPTEQNPIEFAPLVEVTKGEARLPVGNVLYTAILQSFTNRLLEGERRDAFLRVRDLALETHVAQVVEKFFTENASVYRNAFEQPDGQFEHDLIIVYGDEVLIVESKASPPREPFRDPRKAFVRIRHAFSSDRGIQHGFEQGNRIVSRLRRGEDVTPLYRERKRACQDRWGADQIGLRNRRDGQQLRADSDRPFSIATEEC